MTLRIPADQLPVDLLLRAATYALRRPQLNVHELRAECEIGMGRAYQLVRSLTEWKIIAKGPGGVVAWKTTIHPRDAPRVLMAIRQYEGHVPRPHPLEPLVIPGLSVALRRVLDHVADGLNDAEAGALLYLSPDTVKAQVRTVKKVFGARNRAHIVHLAYQFGHLPNPYTPSGKDSS